MPTGYSQLNLPYLLLDAKLPYWSSQRDDGFPLLFLGDYWLQRPLTLLAEKGHFCHRSLTPGAYNAFRQWMIAHEELYKELVDEKRENHPLPLQFAQNMPSAQDLYERCIRRWQRIF